MRGLRVFFILALLLLITTLSYGGIGENFEKAGMAFWGGLNFSWDPNLILDDTDEKNDWTLRLKPGLDYYIADKLALWLSPSLNISSKQKNLNTITNQLTYGLTIGADYYFVSKPQAVSGFVPGIGFTLGLNIDPGMDDTVGGAEVEDLTSSVSLKIGPAFRMNYFLTERVAILLRFLPTVSYRLSQKDNSGAVVALTFEERVYLDTDLYFGFAIYIPSKEASLIKR